MMIIVVVVEGEISVVLTAMRRGNLWSSNTNQDANTENLIKVCPSLLSDLHPNDVDLQH